MPKTFVKDNINFIFGTSTAGQALFCLGGIQLYFTFYFDDVIQKSIDITTNGNTWVMAFLYSLCGVYILASVMMMFTTFLDLAGLCLPFIAINVAVFATLLSFGYYLLFRSDFGWNGFIMRLFPTVEQRYWFQFGSIDATQVLLTTTALYIGWLIIVEWIVIRAFLHLRTWNKGDIYWPTSVPDFFFEFLLNGWSLESLEEVPQDKSKTTSKNIQLA